MDEFLDAFSYTVKGIDEYSLISEYKENNNGNPYLTYTRTIKPTDKLDTIIDNKYTGVMVLCEAKDSFFAVNYQAPGGSFVDEGKIQERFVSLSELCNAVE